MNGTRIFPRSRHNTDNMVKFSETPYQCEEPEMLILILFSRYDLFFFRHTSVLWDTKKRRSLQFLQKICLLPHITSTKRTLKYLVIHPALHGIRKTFENFLALNSLLQEFKYPIFSQNVGGSHTLLHVTTKTRTFA